MTNRTLTFLAKTMAITVLACSNAHSGEWNTNSENVVLDGYDVVAYRTMDRAVKGDPRYAAQYDGVTFFFFNQDNRDTFMRNPEGLAPKYNGFCAFAVGAKGAKVPANADTFKLYNGELLVFFNDVYEGQKFNTKVPWNSDEQELHSKAERNWKNLSRR